MLFLYSSNYNTHKSKTTDMNCEGQTKYLVAILAIYVAFLSVLHAMTSIWTSSTLLSGPADLSLAIGADDSITARNFLDQTLQIKRTKIRIESHQLYPYNLTWHWGQFIASPAITISLINLSVSLNPALIFNKS